MCSSMLSLIVFRIHKGAQCTQRTKRSENASSGRLQEVKAMDNHTPPGPKSGRGRLQEVVVFQRYQLYSFDWENFSVLVGGRLWQVVAYERWSHIEVQLQIMSGLISCSKAPCKRTGFCWPATANIVGCYMLRPSVHPVAYCCVLLGLLVQSLKSVKRQLIRTDGCNDSQRCWANNVRNFCVRLQVA